LDDHWSNQYVRYFGCLFKQKRETIAIVNVLRDEGLEELGLQRYALVISESQCFLNICTAAFPVERLERSFEPIS
jgi:hypothetical protein